MSQLLPVSLFLVTVGSVFLAALWGIVRLGLERYEWLAPPSPRARRLRRLTLGLAFLGTLCISYGYFVEPYWPEVVHLRLECPKLHRLVRLAQISDLHCDPQLRLEERLPDLIAQEHPDVVVFTGDTVNSPGGRPACRRLLSRLAQIAPTFAIKGNWDSWYWSRPAGRELALFEGTGVRELDGQVERVGELAIGGVAVDNEQRFAATVEQMRDAPFSVMLYHLPDAIYYLAGKVDLQLAGHTHGGQVALPLYGALITLSKYGKRFESGLFQVGGTQLYVNRGIGMEGGAPRVRFCSRPEITIIDLAPPAR